MLREPFCRILAIDPVSPNAGTPELVFSTTQDDWPGIGPGDVIAYKGAYYEFFKQRLHFEEVSILGAPFVASVEIFVVRCGGEV